jgi:hypothetical protein
MQLQVRIDQKAAFLAGINAPSSTAKLDVDPAELSQDVRETIHMYLVDGHRLDESVYLPNTDGLMKHSFGPLLEPTVAELIRVAQERRDEVAAIREKLATEKAAKEQRAAAVAEAVRQYCEEFVRDPAGKYYIDTQCEFRFDHIPAIIGVTSTWVRHAEEYFGFSAQAIAIAKTLEATAKNAHAAEEEAKEAAYKAKEKARQAAITAELARIDPDYASQHTAGRMLRETALEIVHNAARRELGLDLSEGAKTFGVSGSFRERDEIHTAAWKEWIRWENELPRGHSEPIFWFAKDDERQIWVAEVKIEHPRIPGVIFHADHLLHTYEIPQQDDSEDCQ